MVGLDKLIMKMIDLNDNNDDFNDLYTDLLDWD